MSDQGLTEYVADFASRVRFKDVPSDVMALGKKSIRDVLGPTLTGSASKASAILQAYIKRLGAARRAHTFILSRQDW
jgi:hypothetical protein